MLRHLVAFQIASTTSQCWRNERWKALVDGLGLGLDLLLIPAIIIYLSKLG